MSKQVTEINLESIVHLDVDAARAIAKRSDAVDLSRLRTMTMEAARTLAQYRGEGMTLGSVDLSEEAAQALLPLIEAGVLWFVGSNTSSEHLSLPGKDFVAEHIHQAKLGPSLAKLYCHQFNASWALCGGLVVRHGEALCAEGLAVLTELLPADATLVLEKIPTLSPHMMASLRNLKCELLLPSLEACSLELASLIASSNASIRIPRSASISSQALGLLFASNGEVTIEGGWGAACNRPEREELAHLLRMAKSRLHMEFDSMILVLAEALADSKCPEISMTVRGGMGKAVAATLARFPGKLRLKACAMGDTESHVALAKKVLADMGWWTSDSLGPNVAKALVDAGLPRLHVSVSRLHAAAAAVLARYVGNLVVSTGTPIEADVADCLAGKSGAGALEIFCASGMSEESAIAFRSCRVPVQLHALNKLTKRTHDQLAGQASITYWPCELHVARAYSDHLHRLQRLILREEDVSWDAMPPRLGISHWYLERVDIERCHGLKAFDFRGRASASPRPEPPLAIRLVDCAAVESITLLTERHCAKGLEFRGLPKCKQVQISTPDLEDLRSLSKLGSVESLVVQNCPRLRSLDGIASLTQITSLTLTNCPELASVTGVEALAKLSQLNLNNCGKLASLDALAAIPELANIELLGATSIKSLHCLGGRAGVSLTLGSDGVGVPPALVKTDYDSAGVSCLDNFEGGIIECASCGGTEFQGVCHGWYSTVHRAIIRRTAVISGGRWAECVGGLLKDIEEDLERDGLDEVGDSEDFNIYPTLDAEVACVGCGSTLEPHSFGASPEMGGAWSDIGSSRRGGRLIGEVSHIVIKFDAKRETPGRVNSSAVTCPICRDGAVRLSLGGVARLDADGKFYGHVRIKDSRWNQLPYCFHEDGSDEKTRGDWYWERAPQATEGAHVECANGCFQAPVDSADHVPALLLATLALFEASQASPDSEWVVAWMRHLGREAGSLVHLVAAASYHLEMLDPEVVPSDSPDADPVELANACRQKAKALMEQALPEAMKAPAATRAKRPSAKKAAKSAPAKKGVSKKSSAASAAVAVPPSQGLQGRVFCFTGRLSGMSRAEAEAKVVALGAKTADSITKKVTDVVVGEGAGSKREKAEKLGLRVFDQAAFEELFHGSAGTTGATASPESPAGGMPSDGAVPKGGSWAALQAAGFAMSGGAQMDAKWHVPDSIVHVQTGATLLLIQPGEFLMGSPESEAARRDDEVQHRRVIRKPFYLGKTAVTQAQWRKVMGSNPGSFKGEDLPVDMVSWDDCQVFLKKAGGGMRLPSEAEWEYACRAGTTTPFAFGATITPKQVNYAGNYADGGASEGLNRERPVDVGSLPANAWGLHEMHGNIWEWCQDGYEDYPRSGTEEPLRAEGARVLRGGSWLHIGGFCRAAQRNMGEPGDRSYFLGLRLARTLPE